MTAVRLERLSIAMEEGRLSAWLVEDGDVVAAGQAIAEVETDKATVEVEAPADGRIRLLVGVGDVVPVESELARVESTDAAAPPERSGDDGAPGAARATVGAPAHAAEALAPPVAGDGAPAGDAPVANGRAPAAGDAGPPRRAASPAARQRARVHGVDLAELTGSGPRGRIVVADVLAAIEDRERAAPQPAGQGGPAPSDTTAPAGASAPVEAAVAAAPAEAPASRDLRAAVLANVTASWRTVPHIHIGGQLAAAGLVRARAAARGRRGPRITATDLLVVSVVQALRDVPELNGSVAADGTARTAEEVHLALAVATSRGVVAPVLRRASDLGVEGVARERARLVEAARAHALDPRDLAGATCTLSNLGGLPVDFFTPVITSPQIALIAIGRVQEQPVVRDGMLGVGHRMWVNAAIDHRGADGEAGGRFLQALERRLDALEAAL